MAATTLLEGEVPGSSAAAAAQPARGDSTLSEQQRRRILIAAAASAALGGPVRIVDMRPTPNGHLSRWVKASRGGVSTGRVPPVLRRGAAAFHEIEPGEGDPLL